MASGRTAGVSPAAPLCVTPTPVDWLLLLPIGAMLAVWAVDLSPVGAQLLAWGASGSGPWWVARSVQLFPLMVAVAAVVGWLSMNRWDWPNLGVSAVGGWRWVMSGAAVGLGLALANFVVITVLVPAWGGSYATLYDTPHARIAWWVMLFVVVPLVAVVVELVFRGFVLGRLLARLPAGILWPWIAIVGAAFFFAWDPFLVMSFRQFHWLGWSDGIVWGYLFYRSGTIVAPMAAHGVEVTVLYSIFKWWLV